MEIDKVLRVAIDKRLQSFLLATATITLPFMRHTQINSFNETVNYRSDDPEQRQLIEQFKTHTQLLLEEAQQNTQHLTENHPILYSWQNYINELKQQVDTLNDILVHSTTNYYMQL